MLFLSVFPIFYPDHMRRTILYISILLIPILFLSCVGEISKEQSVSNGTRLFTLLPSSHTNIEFENELTYTEDFNTYTYRNFYNGGGSCGC